MNHPLRRFDYGQMRELARRAGCSASHLVNIRQGRKNPSLRLAKKLAKITDTRVERWDYPR
jgi:transcriptional regulator with XRE-family HTH domain